MIKIKTRAYKKLTNFATSKNEIKMK